MSATALAVGLPPMSSIGLVPTANSNASTTWRKNTLILREWLLYSSAPGTTQCHWRTHQSKLHRFCVHLPWCAKTKLTPRIARHLTVPPVLYSTIFSPTAIWWGVTTQKNNKNIFFYYSRSGGWWSVSGHSVLCLPPPVWGGRSLKKAFASSYYSSSFLWLAIGSFEKRFLTSVRGVQTFVTLLCTTLVGGTALEGCKSAREEKVMFSGSGRSPIFGFEKKRQHQSTESYFYKI